MVRGLLAAVAVLVSVGLAHAEKRIALVIGNTSYIALSAVANAGHDAALIARTLKSMDFEVASVTDADMHAMGQAVRDFSNALRSAGKDTIGLFYFAGHGLQASGANYLLPVDARIAAESDLAAAAISATGVIADMTAAGNALNLVIVDASRNNPFQQKLRSGGRGLAGIESPPTVLAALAAAPGRVATDGAAENSPYALALAEALPEPGLSIGQVFAKARARVESMTAGTQSPWETASVDREFYLSGPPPPKPEPPVPVAAAPEAPAPQPDKEVAFWNTVKDSTSVAVLQTYLDQYPNGAFVPLAQVLIEGLRAEAEQEQQRREAEQHQKDEAARLAALTPPAPVEPDLPDSPSGMVALGIGYETGDGVNKDPAKAAEWYLQAARSGSSEGAYRLGLLRYRGEGVERDYKEAAARILDAVKGNHAPAVAALSDPTTLNEREFLKAVQGWLKELGYYRSAIDGLWGPGSRNAVLALSRGAPIPAVRRAAPAAARSATVRGRTPSAADSGSRDRANPQCARWGKDFNNPGCAFGL